MSRQERIKIQAKNIDAAAGEILGVLEDTSKGNVVYFGGWLGFGASAALKVVAQRLKSSKSKFDKVIHVDCSVWKSMRTLQKGVAEELELPRSVMAIFDRHDEEDDFNGVEQGSRGVIEDIRVIIFRKLLNSRFVVVFHNGSNRYIDLYECGVPIISLMSNKVLWTWHGKFRLVLDLEPGEQEKMDRLTDVCFHTSLEYERKELQDLVYEEADEVAKCTEIAEPNYMNHKVVKQCILYAWALRMSPTGVDLKNHEPNYWICNGIIQGQGNTTAWEIGDSVQRNMRCDWVGTTTNAETIGLCQEGSNILSRYDQRIAGQLLNEEATALCLTLFQDLDDEQDRWGFTTHQELLNYNTDDVLPPEMTSFFVFESQPSANTISILPVSMFLHSDSSQLRVLHLSRCTFSFASPPFLCCSQLRFLYLDHCINISDEEDQSHNENLSCFRKLWVLDLRYTDWYWLLSERMKILMVDLRELNLEGVKHAGSINDLFCGRPNLVILRVIAEAVPSNMSSANIFKTSSLADNVLAPSLESFSYINKAAAGAPKISSSISFRGCSQLKSILLSGCVKELDLSGTAVKTLDLRHVEILNLSRLVLLGCEKLCAILWPRVKEMSRYFWHMELHINTFRPASPTQATLEEKTKEASSAIRSSSNFFFGARQDFFFGWYICLRDARLLRSLAPFEERFSGKIHMEMDSTPGSRVSAGGSEVAQGIMSLQQHDHYLYARDVIFEGHEEDGADNEDTTSWIWACPPRPNPWMHDWYIHMQDDEEMQQQQSSIEGTSTSAVLPPSYIYNTTRILHVHDSQFITHIPWPQNSFWESLEWCRVERCSELCSVFATPQESGCKIFRELETFWASQLSMACYIWNWRAISKISGKSFRFLEFLHLDYCPRLIHVLPFSVHMATLPSLETLEVVCCGDLREVFPLDPKRQEKHELIKFPELRRIHLYELPVLQLICGSRMFAPKLETVKIRGCWSLRRLPTVSGKTTNRPKVDCEKDWWDNLEWDGVEMNHHPSLYEPTHSRYYKKSHLPRGTVLR